MSRGLYYERGLFYHVRLMIADRLTWCAVLIMPDGIDRDEFLVGWKKYLDNSTARLRYDIDARKQRKYR